MQEASELRAGTTGADRRVRVLSEREYTAVAVVAALVAVLGLLGFVNSFAGVQRAAEPSFGWLSFTVPIGIDLGIAVFSALDIVLARLDMRIRWLRLIPWALTGVTVYLNVAGQHGLFGQVAHAVLPCLWVLAVEVAAHVIRVRAQLVADTRMDTIRRSRWVLAPWPTWKLWRRMVLWETRSYPDALARERDRLLTLTELQDRYGRMAWRWKAPRRERALYRLGELAPAADLPAPPAPADEPQPIEAAPKPRKPRTTRRRTKRAPAPDVDDLMPLGWRVAADLAAAGRPLTRDALRDALKDAGASASNHRAGALLARLRTEAPTDPAEMATVDGGDR
ncbi:MAG TPA: DUF2637 domain-containing protein [Streptosporangiaceae bacterium]|jgi:hypothetical protein